MKRKWLYSAIIVAIITVFTSVVTAQVSGYNFTSAIGDWQNLTQATVLGSGNGLDDQFYTNVPVGFTFNFNGNNFTEVSVSCNGYIVFGNTNLGTLPISSALGAPGCAAACANDLKAGHNQAQVAYRTQGSSPNRVFTVQWRRFQRKNPGAGEQFWFQIKLYETSNIIQFYYNQYSPLNSANGVQVGLRGATNSDFFNRQTTTDWSATTAGTSNSATCTLTGAINPDNDLYFEFDPVVQDPAAFDAMAAGQTQIDLSFTKNSNNNNVVIVWNSTNSFGVPSGTPPAQGQPFAGATMLYSGGTSPQNHTGLTPGTYYYYKIFSYNGSKYSAGIVDSAATSVAAPYELSLDDCDAPLWSQISNVSPPRWSISNTANAGGSPCELMASWSTGTGTTRLISPAIDLSTATAPYLIFNHLYDDWGTGCTFTVQSSTDGTNWTTLYTINSGSGNIGPATQYLAVPAFGPATYFQWVITGNHYQFDYWYLDDIIVQDGAGFWTGNANTAWNNTANWVGGAIPTATSNAFIPAGRPNYPVITVNATCKNLTVKDLASVTISNTGQLQVNADLVNKGTMTNSGILNITGDYLSEATGVMNQLAGTWNMNWFTSSDFWGDGTLVLSGGNITNYGAILAAFTTITMNGPFNWYLQGEAARWDGANFTAAPTGGTFHVTGTASDIYLYGPTASTNMWFYNLNINPAAGSTVHLNPDWGTTDMTVYNNLYVKSGSTSTDNLGSLSNIFSVNGSAAVYENAAMTLNTSTLGNISGNLTIVSTAAGTGSWIDNGTAVVGGTSMVDRYITPGQWHYVSSPMSNALTGVFTGAYLKEWYENTYAWSPYIVPVNLPLTVTKGFELYKTGSPKVYHYTGGTINTGNKTATVTATDRNGNSQILWGDYEGWNFVGNPYPSALMWNASWAKNRIDPTLYIWDGSIGQYAQWNHVTGIGINKTDGTIPANQGFFVHANAFNPSLIMPQSQRFHSTQAFYKSEPLEPGRFAASVNPEEVRVITDEQPELKSGNLKSDIIRLTVNGNNMKDETVIFFTDPATDSFDADYDSYKLDGSSAAPQLYTLIEGVKIAMNGTNNKSSDRVYPVYFGCGAAGTYTISTSLSGDFEFAPVYLEDLLTGNIINTRVTDSYSFVADPSDNPARFLVYFNAGPNPGPAGDITMDSGIFAYGNTIYVNQAESIRAEVFVYNMLGQLLTSGSFEPSTSIRLNAGNYQGHAIVKVITEKGTKTQKVLVQ